MLAKSVLAPVAKMVLLERHALRLPKCSLAWPVQLVTCNHRHEMRTSSHVGGCTRSHVSGHGSQASMNGGTGAKTNPKRVRKSQAAVESSKRVQTFNCNEIHQLQRPIVPKCGMTKSVSWSISKIFPKPHAFVAKGAPENPQDNFPWISSQSCADW